MKFLIFFGILGVWSVEIQAQMCSKRGSECTFRSVRLRENQVLTNTASDRNIKTVRFVNSNLHAVPAEIFNFYDNLEMAHLTGQNIQQINENSFINAKELKYLTLNGNKIKILKANAFVGSDNLEQLYILQNQLETIEQGAFNGLPKLLTLDLGENKIVHILHNTFDQLPNLEVIKLNHNQIEVINEDIFKFNLKLDEISLWTNRINFLSHKTFSNLKNLYRLDLGNNKCVDRAWLLKVHQATMDEIVEKLGDCDSNYSQMEKKI